MPPHRWVWCSCTIIDYLKGEERAQECELILGQAERGEIEIVVSTLALAEVAKLEGPHAEAEGRIKEFFQRKYIVPAVVDVLVAEEARRILWTYQLKPLDAIHIATALRYKVPILETYDDEMIKKADQREGNPVLRVRHPTYEGPIRLPTL